MQRFDLLLIKGNTLNSKIIKAVTGSHYSHVAIVLDSYHVVETDIRYPLQIRHINYPRKMVDVYRYHKDLTFKQKEIMEAYVLSKLQTEYDLALTISNGLFLIAKIPIKNAVKRLNCTEAAYEMYKAAGIDLEADLTPGGLAASQKLKYIGNLGAGVYGYGT